MSYPKDLNEYTDIELLEELGGRAESRAGGRCDYCGRLPIEPECKFPGRHGRLFTQVDSEVRRRLEIAERKLKQVSTVIFSDTVQDAQK